LRAVFSKNYQKKIMGTRVRIFDLFFGAYFFQKLPKGFRRVHTWRDKNGGRGALSFKGFKGFKKGFRCF